VASRRGSFGPNASRPALFATPPSSLPTSSPLGPPAASSGGFASIGRARAGSSAVVTPAEAAGSPVAGSAPAAPHGSGANVPTANGA
jgi:hypothetical protein